MIPTVHIEDRIIVNKAAYGIRIPFTGLYVVNFQEPAPGEVVVLESPEDDKILLKRVVAGPGDLIAVRQGRLWLNSVPVPIEARSDGEYERLGASVHAIQRTGEGGPDFGPVQIPTDLFLVLGDNRGDSRDGRSFGLVQRSKILGRAMGVYMRDGGFIWQPL